MKTNIKTQEEREAEQKAKLLQLIKDGHHPCCIHILGQPLADALTEIIRDQQKEIDELKYHLTKNMESAHE